MSEPIFRDPVVAEIHAIRQKLLEERDNDPARYMEELPKRQQFPGSGGSRGGKWENKK